MVQYEIKITGRVQGVGYRHFSQKQANNFGLKGWVKNTVDNGVLVMVQGEETVIETFIDYLRIGPTRSRINSITKARMEIVEAFTNFEVRV